MLGAKLVRRVPSLANCATVPMIPVRIIANPRILRTVDKLSSAFIFAFIGHLTFAKVPLNSRLLPWSASTRVWKPRFSSVPGLSRCAQWPQEPRHFLGGNTRSVPLPSARRRFHGCKWPATPFLNHRNGSVQDFELRPCATRDLFQTAPPERVFPIRQQEKTPAGFPGGGPLKFPPGITVRVH